MCRWRVYRLGKPTLSVKDIQTFLTEDMCFNAQFKPQETWWDWQGHHVHIDRFNKPASPVRVILLHGMGTNGRQMSLIVGGPLSKRGYETLAIDMPGYGLTKVNPEDKFTYDTWVQLASDFIDAERARDPRPLVLYGLSAGGKHREG